MSVVYEAYDDRLDRTVALKLLRERGGRRRQARLQREAQALARLSHPNVVEVYETGSHGGRAFLVMERLPGEPLHRWIAAAPRTVQAVVDTFVAAGRGLAAAHAHGLVHRDFKPSNVLVDADGRVRVFDFGLAAPSGVPSEDSIRTGRNPLASGPNTAGTGPHAVASGSHPALAGALGDLDVNTSYDEIWESALTRTGAMLGTPAYMSPEQYEGRPATAQSDQFAFCVALREALHGEHPFVERQQWDLLPKHVMEGKLREPPGGRGVPAALERVLVRGLSVRPYMRWPSMEVLLVELQRAMGYRRRVAWISGAALVTASAAGLVLWLGRPPADASPCDPCDLASEAVLGETPADPELARRIEAHREALAQAKALERAGQYRAGLEVAVPVALAADALDHPPLRAEAQLQVGLLQRYLGAHDEAERALERAYFLGQELERDELAREAVTMLAYVVARLQLRPDDGMRWLEAARVAAERVGGDKAWADYLDTEGSVLWAARRHDEALARYQLALPLLEKEWGPQHPEVAGVLNNIGLLLLELDRPDVALDYIRRSLAIRETALGSQHPEVGKMLNNLGLALLRAGRDDEAIVSFERAHELRRRVLGPGHPDVAKPLANLAAVQLQQGRLDAAAEHATQALAIRERAHGVDSVEAAMMHALVGQVRLAQDHDEEARQSLTRAVLAIEQALGADRVELVEPLFHLAEAERRLGRRSQALAHVQRGLAIGSAEGVEPWDLAAGRLVLSRVQWDAGDRVLAWAAAEAARKAYASVPRSRRPRMAAEIAELEAWLSELDAP